MKEERKLHLRTQDYHHGRYQGRDDSPTSYHNHEPDRNGLEKQLVRKETTKNGHYEPTGDDYGYHNGSDRNRDRLETKTQNTQTSIMGVTTFKFFIMGVMKGVMTS